jgi:hypothetical protein
MPEDMPELRVRVSDDDRDRTVERLQRAFVEGRLTSDEMDERLGRALMARSRSDLVTAITDLPDARGDEVVELSSTGGRITRAGDWRVPRRLRIDSQYGGVRLDLSEAVIEHRTIEIELRLAYGSATIILPPGTTVNADGTRTTWGRVTVRAARRTGPERLHVRIAGELDYGHLRIRHSRGWKRSRGPRSAWST